MRIRITGRSAVVSAAAVAALLSALPAGAQEGGARWQAWYGCWETAADAAAPVDAQGSTMACVVPTADPEAVGRKATRVFP